MRKLITTSVLMVLLLTFACNKETEPELQDTALELQEIEEAELLLNQPGLEESQARLNSRFNITKTKADINDLVNGGIVGKATLFRSKDGIFLLYYVDALIPWHTYTVWWGVWNNPEECVDPTACGVNEADFANFALTKPDLMYATGRVARHNGKLLFWAYLGENDNEGSIAHLFGLPSAGGLLDAENALIYAILRSHGPAVPGIISEQIGTYLGGCPTEFPYGFPPFTEIPDEVGECGDIYEAVFIAP